MKIKSILPNRTTDQVAVITILLILIAFNTRALSQGTAFTFEGILRDLSGNPAAGPHTLSFSIWDKDTGGMSLWQDASPRQRTIPADGSVVEMVDPGPGIFTGVQRWLQVDVD